jgi:hypothetical protein
MEDIQARVAQYIKFLRARLGAWFSTLQPNQKSYLNAAVFGLLSLPASLLSQDFSLVLKGVAVVCWGMAMIADVQALCKTVVESLVGKLFLLAAIALGTNFGIAHAAQIVNELVGIDPSRFVHTIGYASFLLVLPMVALAMVFTFFLGLLLIPLFVLFHLVSDEKSKSFLFPWYRPKPEMRHRTLTVCAQGLSILTLCWFAYSWTKTDSGYDKFIRRSAEWFLYSFEMYERAPCALEAGQRVAFLDANQVLIATKVTDQVSFKVGECKAL